MLLPLNDAVWRDFLRGVFFGFVGGLVLIVPFFWSDKHRALIALKPTSYLYFLAGVS